MAADEHAVAVVVRDHGLGLKPGEAGLVFNRFWRADPSRQRRSGGTGLGLAISLEDARLQGGWLQAWGETDHGAVFRLTLPRVAGTLLRTSPLPLIPVTAAPGEAEPGNPGGGGHHRHRAAPAHRGVPHRADRGRRRGRRRRRQPAARRRSARSGLGARGDVAGSVPAAAVAHR